MTAKVKLIAKTVPVEHQGSAKELIAFMARVSNPKSQEAGEGSERLLNYLMNHQHWSPFEMVNFVMEIETTRDIARQILRHRSFSFQEFSQRYADPTEFLGFDYREARIQDEKNRQNSFATNDREKVWLWTKAQQRVADVALSEYNRVRDMGIAKEQARALLPEGITVSRMYMNGTLRSWIHYCKLRMQEDTQKEHREVAQLCWDIIQEEMK